MWPPDAPAARARLASGVSMKSEASPLPQGLVRLRDISPAIRQDIRYASENNFTGAPAPGYEAAECWLLEPVARALASVAEDAAREGLMLIVWDGYRPQRASDHFLLWSQTQDATPDAARLRARFHPRVDRRDLFARGFLSERSSHSRGAAVDLGFSTPTALCWISAQSSIFSTISPPLTARTCRRPRAPTARCCVG